MGGTKWNKGGTSKGTYGPVGWDLFAIQILPSVGSRGAENGLPCLETTPSLRLESKPLQLKIKTPSQYF